LKINKDFSDGDEDGEGLLAPVTKCPG